MRCTKKVMILVKVGIYQPVTTKPAISMYNQSLVLVTKDNLKQCGLGAARHDFGLNHKLAIKQHNVNLLNVCSSSTTTIYSFPTEVGLIYFNRTIQKRRILKALSQSLKNRQVARNHKSTRDTRNYCSSHDCQIFFKHLNSWRNQAQLIL